MTQPTPATPAQAFVRRILAIVFVAAPIMIGLALLWVFEVIEMRVFLIALGVVVVAESVAMVSAIRQHQKALRGPATYDHVEELRRRAES